MTKLLVADDLERQRHQIVNAARRVGFLDDDIAQADSVDAAIKAIQSSPFNIAVIDIVWDANDSSNRDGLQVIQRLKELQPECKIIAFSANVGNEVGREVLQAGADDFVSQRWQSINWVYLLEVRLELWRSLVEGAAAGLV